jgi:GNAT superfamily N-acetyltransferase
MIDYRTMNADDIDAGLTLCRSAGWNQLDNDWKLFLDLTPGGSRVAIDENGKVVGTAATIDYEDHFSWIGMVLVDPEKKRQGIGTQLLREALKILEKQQTAKLDATPAGREVYLKLGFVDEYSLSRMVLKEKIKLPLSDAAETKMEDLTVILREDENVFGASREELLRRIYKDNPELSFIIKNGAHIAYSFGRKGYNFTQIGPVVADNDAVAQRLVSAALNKLSGSVVIDVMDNSPFQQWLTQLGFTEQRKLVRMYRGTNAYPGIPEKQFAILGPEFG